MKSKFNEEEKKNAAHKSWQWKRNWMWRDWNWLLCGCTSLCDLANMTKVWYVWNAQVQIKENTRESHCMKIMMRFAIAQVSVTFFVSFREFDKHLAHLLHLCRRTIKLRVKTNGWQKTHSRNYMLLTMVFRLNGVLNQGLSVSGSEQWHSMMIIAMDKRYFIFL